MAMTAENFLDQVKKGNANAQNPWPGMAQMMGGAGMPNANGMPLNFGAPPGAMGMQGFQMPAMGAMPMPIGQNGMMNPMMGMNGSNGQFNGMQNNFNQEFTATTRQ